MVHERVAVFVAVGIGWNMQQHPLLQICPTGDASVAVARLLQPRSTGRVLHCWVHSVVGEYFRGHMCLAKHRVPLPLLQNSNWCAHRKQSETDQKWTAGTNEHFCSLSSPRQVSDCQALIPRFQSSRFPSARH